ncbi:DUF1573 domain-containing protein [Flavobacterium aciduliphilum]|uniref:Uncharacterized protein DUF1573 n=1 Tax=Flavobacterium aciduliphilum TaxID=1101402 RepID=A0A328YE36_9FLAO|nr:DUF1573 domain-containing protein [Flavobacterium aciduliphilum]RAR71810.1 uncharacterized protein DUF1573 [Flavobacterium aciduliphilum]
MKKILFLSMLVAFGVTTANAQTKGKAKKSTKPVAAAPAKVEAAPVKVEATKTPAAEGAGMVFENETIDYGTIPHNAEGTREFVFTNNGTSPLVIESTQGSCGCTVPTKPEKPIQPGEKGVIKVHYATDRVGQFEKTVTIKSNAVGQETKVVRIKGNVLPDPTPAATEPKN